MKHVSIVAMFCDDIREEKGETYTLVGILPDNVQVPAIPGAFPKLGLYVRAHIDLDLKPIVTDLIVNIRLPNGVEQELNKIPKDVILTEMGNVKGGGTYVGLVTHAIAANFSIPTAGLVQVIGKFAGQDYICGHMNVEASPQHDKVEAAG